MSMPIIFEVLAAPAGYTAVGRVGISLYAVTDAAGYRASGRIGVRARGRVAYTLRGRVGLRVASRQRVAGAYAYLRAGVSAYATMQTLAPDVRYGYGTVGVGLSGSFHQELHLSADLGIGVAGLGSVARFVGRGRIGVGGAGRVRGPGAYLNAYLLPYLYITTGAPRIRVTARVALETNVLANAINCLLERVSLTPQPRTILQGLSRLVDAVDATDRLAVVWRLLVGDAVDVTATSGPSVAVIEQVLEALKLAAGPGSALAATNLVAEALALQDVIASVAKEQVTDGVAVAAAFRIALAARERMIDALEVAAVPSGVARSLAIVDDGLALGDTPASRIDALQRVQETIGFSLTFTIGDDTYVAWVVNTETRAAWTYTHFPFNSFCEFEGRYYGAAADGIYALDGDTDDGEVIKARIRLGMSNLGIAQEKRMPALYIAYAATGRMVLKAIVTEIDGSRTEWWYQLVPRGTGGVREGRVQLGRGLKAVFWDFELANVDGADFELAGLQFQPMVLDRRIRGRDSD